MSNYTLKCPEYHIFTTGLSSASSKFWSKITVNCFCYLPWKEFAGKKERRGPDKRAVQLKRFYDLIGKYTKSDKSFFIFEENILAEWRGNAFAYSNIQMLQHLSAKQLNTKCTTIHKIQLYANPIPGNP